MNAAGKKIVVIAGPNGAGKTTFAREFLPNEGDCLEFVNADLIAQGLSPFRPEAAAFRAGRLMLEEVRRLASEGRSFAFETTLSGRAYAPMMDAWRKQGYQIKLVFLTLSSVEDAVSRVATRVRQGGHDVPPEVVRRRFVAGRRLFREVYSKRVDWWQLYDNGGPMPLLIEEGRNP